MQRSNTSVIAHLLLLATVLVWGVTFVVVKDALRDASPLLFNLLRMGLAFLVLAVINRRHLYPLSGRAVLSGAVVGILLAIGYQFQTAGLARTTPAKSAFVTGLVVVFVPLFMAIPILRPEGTPAPRPIAFAGATLAFAGLFLLTTPTGTAVRDLFRAIGLGDLLTLVCALAFAGHLLALGHTSKALPAAQLATLQIGVAAAFMALTLPFGGALYLHLSLRLVIALAVTSLLGTAAAFTIQSWAQKYLPPAHTALILVLEPVFAWVTALLFLKEQLDRRSLAGAALIFAGIALTELLPISSAPEIPI